uniref:Uncharacterized protein n=1 Tax=Panagrolaimus superbus TaxID=310955 RepID=A0A914YPH9_9BILA
MPSPPPPLSPMKKGSEQFESFPMPQQPIALAFDTVEIEVETDKIDEIGKEFKALPMRQRSRKISDVSAQDFS